MKTIGSSAFEGCSALKGDLVLPDSVTSIGSSAFRDCSGLTGSLKLPSGLTSLGGSAFYNCYNIKGELVIPDGITDLDQKVFYNMDGITSVVIGAGVTSVYEYSYNSEFSPFFGCDNIKEMTFLGEKPPSGNPFNEIGSALTTVYVPAESYDLYAAAFRTYLSSTVRLTADGSGEFLIVDGVLMAYLGNSAEAVIPDGVVTVGTGAFQNCKTVTRVVVPDSVTKIESYAFSGCSGLLEIEFASGLESIGEKAFSGCAKLTVLTFPDTLKTIGSNAFEGCVKITGVSFPDSLETIGSYAFSGCEKIARLTLPGSLKTIGGYAFSGCSGIKGDLVIPSAVTSIGECAFQNCSGMKGKLTIEAKDVTVEDYKGLTIGSYAFSGLQFTSVSLGEGVKTIGSSAFEGCSALKGDLVLPDSVTSIGSSAFRDCSGLTGSLKLPSGLTSLGECAFYNCYNIKGELVIPDGITYLDSGVFYNMDGITSVVIGAGVTSVYSSYSYTPFYGCDNIKEMTFLGEKPPSNNPFANIGGALTTVYVPEESYDLYAAAFKTYLSANVRMSILKNIPDKLNVTISHNDKAILLAWEPDTDKATAGYHVYRKAEGEKEFTLLVRITDKNATGYADTDVVYGGSYQYYVKIVNYFDVESNAFDILTESMPPIPEKPTNLKVLSAWDTIELEWRSSQSGMRYAVYRAEGKDGEYKKIATVEELQYSDRSVSDDIEYHYYVVAEDSYGIASEASNIVSAVLLHDHTAPVIESFTPEEGAVLYKNAKFEVLVRDNALVSHLTWMYKKQGGVYEELFTAQVGKNEAVVTYEWDLSELTPGKYVIKIQASDAAGNLSEPIEVTYEVREYIEPVMPILVGTGGFEKVSLTWTYGGVQELVKHYTLYLKGPDGTFTRIATTKETYFDYPITPGEYTYKVVMTDVYGAE